MSLDIHKIRKGQKLVLAYPYNGYDHHKKQAEEAIAKFGDHPTFTVKSVDIGSWSTTINFEEIEGHWNSVQFDFFPLKKWLVTKTVSLSYVAEVHAGTEFDATAVARHLEDDAYELASKKPEFEYSATRVTSEYENEQKILNQKQQNVIDKVYDVLIAEVESSNNIDYLLQLTPDELIKVFFAKRVYD